MPPLRPWKLPGHTRCWHARALPSAAIANCPIQLRLEDGRLLEGVIDLAFLEQDRWVVVDFKSDVGNSARYERQLQWYLYALSKLTGREAAGYLLRI